MNTRAASPTPGLAVLLSTLVALGPLSTDLYLPSLPSLQTALATDAARVQLTLSVFLAGFAVAQLACGALSDRYGRRPVMLGGLALYFVASLACTVAGSIETLIVARFVQAVGACVGPVLGRAVVRDVWGPTEAGRVLSYVSAAMALAPLVGPTLGGFLTVTFGWRANFALLAFFSALQGWATWRWLGESNHHPDPAATSPRRLAGNFARLLADRHYVGYLLCLAFSYSALFAFISGSSFVLIGRYGLSPQVFGLSFGLVVVGYIVGTVSSGRLARRLGGRRLLLAGACIGAVAGVSMWALDLAGVASPWAILAPMFFCTVALGMVMPNAVALALAPYARMAGAAAALLGFAQMGIAALAGIIVGHGIADASSDGILPRVVAVCGLIVPLVYWGLVREARAD